jgi:hypothetical protein
MPAPTDAPAHSFLKMLDPASGLAPGDPARMAARIIDSVDVEPAPLRIVLGFRRWRASVRRCARGSLTSNAPVGLDTSTLQPAYWNCQASMPVPQPRSSTSAQGPAATIRSTKASRVRGRVRS